MSQKLKGVFSTFITIIFLFSVYNIHKAQSILLSPDTSYVGQIPMNSKVFSKNLGIYSFAVGVLLPVVISFFVTLVLGYVLSIFIGKNTMKHLIINGEML